MDVLYFISVILWFTGGIWQMAKISAVIDRNIIIKPPHVSLWLHISVCMLVFLTWPITLMNTNITRVYYGKSL